ncbi:amidase [Anaerocolumna cellulosilytica]|uniref:Amidase n=1 Tax=Anaerocolumna cellulosilytica TaxID=433286 RepID=A0A6S6R4Q3_9FIRM|nr:cysteine hydrolase family protein [Anaerocolumna cellulosilytica]MBB5196436.1 nicotinamidase-related amidase [Anaerocolumna cellulosilytica]BCJ94442.1 amidase [Anaerocolumna cellulosilytica]
MKYDALIIVDMQTALVEAGPYNREVVIENIKAVLNSCRNSLIPVIYIQHDGGQGDELEHGSIGWTIYSDISPMADEKIFDKQYNSAFRKTGLHSYLQEIGAKNIILCGMQTEYCLDATCKVAFEYGYNVTIPRSTTTTFDNNFASGKDLTEYYENQIWKNRYAQIISIEQVV